MTAAQFESKTKSLAKMRIKYKWHVIYDDNAQKVKLIKDIVDKLEKELKNGSTKRE